MTFRSKIIALQSERDKLALEAEFFREKADSLMKESEHKVNKVVLSMFFIYTCACSCQESRSKINYSYGIFVLLVTISLGVLC